ncbi:hypothetical protein [Salinimicrobium xinjiangense]|uniref:hypothetical protein n=1 Tax=Salinimicrobium xinjiangense TaxID=438596 RepID=UPI0004235B27|nr:hypothetical protein [Salinimicrobium xinjiangense]
MEREKLILQDSFTTHQKIHLLGLSSPVLVIIIDLLGLGLHWSSPFFILFFAAIILIVAIIAFSKKGFLKSDGKLFKARFFRGKVLFASSINILDRPVISILKFRRSRKYAFFSAAKPDLASSFNSFEVYVLNDRHIKRDLLMRLTSEEKAQQAIGFLTSDLLLRHEIYSPNFGHARIGRR